MALTQQDKEEMLQFLITRGKSLGSLDEGDSNLSNKYLAPVLEYSGGTASKAVRLAVSLLQGKSAILRKSGDLVQWQLQGASTWETLYSMADYRGLPGAAANLTIGTVASGDIPAASITGDAPEFKLNLTLVPGKIGETGKTPVLASVNAQAGNTPSGNFTTDGVDESGNPKYILNVTLPKGNDGQPPIFEQGTTTTVEPTIGASVEIVENGYSTEGNPMYILNFSIPKGEKGAPGMGAGNVLVNGTGLVAGKKYLFVPIATNSTEGNFVEYDFPDAPSDGKIYGRKDKAWVEVNVDQIAYLPIDLLSLEPGVATSDEIKQALGGDDAFKKLLEDIASGKTLAMSIPGEATITLGTCMVKFADEQDPSQALSFNYADAGIALTVATTSVYNGTYSFELNSAGGGGLIVENERNLGQGFYVVHKASGSNYLSKIFKIPTIILPVEFLNLNSNSTNEEIASIFNTQVEVNNGYSSYKVTLFKILQSYLEQDYYSFIPIITTRSYYPYRPIPVKYIYESGDDSIVIEYAQNGVNHKVVVTLKSSVYSIVKESHSQYPIISTLAPTSADGNDGDIWIQYSN